MKKGGQEGELQTAEQIWKGLGRWGSPEQRFPIIGVMSNRNVMALVSLLGSVWLVSNQRTLLESQICSIWKIAASYPPCSRFSWRAISAAYLHGWHISSHRWEARFMDVRSMANLQWTETWKTKLVGYVEEFKPWIQPSLGHFFGIQHYSVSWFLWPCQNSSPYRPRFYM